MTATTLTAQAVNDHSMGEPEVLVFEATYEDGMLTDTGDPIARTDWDAEEETADDALARLGYRLPFGVEWDTTDYGGGAIVEPT